MRRGGLLTMYIVKLPSGEYINLAFVQRIEMDYVESQIALVHWHGGGRNPYRDLDAQAIVKAVSNTCLDFSNEQTT